MRYTVIYNQLGLIKYNEDYPEKLIDFIDMILLEQINELTKWPDINTKVFFNEKYYWIAYKKLLEELPTIPIKTKDAIAKRFTTLIEYNLMQRFIDKKDNSKTYFNLTSNGLKYVTYRNTDRHPIGLQSDTLSDVNTTNKNTINKNANYEREFSHFDFLNEKYSKEIERILKQYPLSDKELKFCINKFNDEKYKNLNCTHFENYIYNWHSNSKRYTNNNNFQGIPKFKKIG